MKKGTILSIDDDENLRMVVSSYLDGDGYEVLSADSIKTALEQADNSDIDVILLDLVLPDGEGLDIIPKLRSLNKAGIIVVSGKDSTMEKIVCLEMGADDYMTKPFEMRELSARIKAVMRRMDVEVANNNVDDKGDSGSRGEEGDDTEKPLRFKQWTLDYGRYQVYDNKGTSADLTSGEVELLDILLKSAGRVLTREQLFERTRDGHYDAYDRAVDIQIGRLRKKLEDNPSSPTLIKTVRGVGYMFCEKPEAVA